MRSCISAAPTGTLLRLSSCGEEYIENLRRLYSEQRSVQTAAASPENKHCGL